MQLEEVKVSTKMVEDTSKSRKKSKVLGPDNIAPIHLHFFGKQAINFSRKIISFSLSNEIIPENWKKNPSQNRKRYRTSLELQTNCIDLSRNKLVERILLPDLTLT